MKEVDFIILLYSFFTNLGYVNDIESENKMRKCSTLPWFKRTIMVFRKKINNDV